MIEDLKRDGVTVLITSHLLDQVQRLCDRVALFQRRPHPDDGDGAGTRAPGAGRRLRGRRRGHRRAGQELAARLGAIPGVTTVADATGDIHYRLTADHDVRPDAARAVVAADGALTRLSVDNPSLDAIYTRFFEKQAATEKEMRDAA